MKTLEQAWQEFAVGAFGPDITPHNLTLFRLTYLSGSQAMRNVLGELAAESATAQDYLAGIAQIENELAAFAGEVNPPRDGAIH